MWGGRGDPRQVAGWEEEVCVRLGGQLLFQKHGGVLPYRETRRRLLPLVTAPTYPGVVQACLHSIWKTKTSLISRWLDHMECIFKSLAIHMKALLTFK